MLHDGSDWSIGWLMKIDQIDPTGYTSIMGTGEGGTARGFDISFDDDSQDHGLRIRMEDGTGWGNQIKIGSAIPKDTTNWYHYVVTHEGVGTTTSNWEIFRDGVSLGTAVGGAGGSNAGFVFNTNSPTHDMRLGLHSSHSMWKYFHGDMDDVIIYDSKLSATQVSELYSSGSVNGVSPYASYNFEQTSGALTDQSGNGYDGSNAGATQTATGATITASTPFSNTIIEATGLADNTSTAKNYVFTRSGNDWTIYQNGVSQVTATDTTSLGSHIGSASTTFNAGTTDAGFNSNMKGFGNKIQSGNDLIGKSITGLGFYFKGTTSATLTLGVFDTTSSTPSCTMGTVSGSTLTSSYQLYEVTNNSGCTVSTDQLLGFYTSGDISNLNVQRYNSGTGAESTQFAMYHALSSGSNWQNAGDHQDANMVVSYPSLVDYTTHIDGMVDEYFINSDALTSTEVNNVATRGVDAWTILPNPNDYALLQTPLPDGSVNESGSTGEEIDFTNNEFLTHGFENGSLEDKSTNSITVNAPSGVVEGSWEDVVWDPTTMSGGSISGNTFTDSVAGFGNGIAQSVQTINPATGGGEMKCTKSYSYAMCGFAKDPYWTSGDVYKNGGNSHMMYRSDVYEYENFVYTSPISGLTTSASSVYGISIDENGNCKW
jgi:hypothetical protein